MRVTFINLSPVFGVFALLGQNAGAPAAPAAMPEYVLYRFVFERVGAQERFGDHLDAGCHDSSEVRSKIRNAAGLTEAEDAALKSIAKDFLAVRTMFYSERDKLYKEMKARARNWGLRFRHRCPNKRT